MNSICPQTPFADEELELFVDGIIERLKGNSEPEADIAVKISAQIDVAFFNLINTIGDRQV